jgi:hypothetical protein
LQELTLEKQLGHGSNVASTEPNKNVCPVHQLANYEGDLPLVRRKKEEEEERRRRSREKTEYLWEPLLLGELAGGLMT